MGSPEQLQPGERNLAPEFKPGERVYGLVPRLDMSDERTFDVPVEVVIQNTDFVRGTDSGITDEDARIAHAKKISKAGHGAISLFDPHPGYPSTDHKRSGGDNSES